LPVGLRSSLPTVEQIEAELGEAGKVTTKSASRAKKAK
jgi:hypothetical protein